jgi:tRNA A37 methylthiotransferase MiaB
MRGDLVSRPIGEVLREAEVLAAAGVKELLVISQDTSAYGVDVKYRTGFHDGRPVKTRLLELCKRTGQARTLGAPALRLSLPQRRRPDPADGGRARSCPTSTCPSSTPARASSS